MSTTTIFHLFAVAFAGGIGTLSRYGISVMATRLFGTAFPWGTFIVNMVGCFLFGMLSAMILTERVPTEWKVILLTGFLGGFTTFSAFSFENYGLLVEGDWTKLMLNMLVQNLLGLMAVAAGIGLVGKMIYPS